MIVRSWIDMLEGKMTHAQKAALPCYAEDSTVKMVNKYIDRGGHQRVWGYLVIDGLVRQLKLEKHVVVYMLLYSNFAQC